MSKKKRIGTLNVATGRFTPLKQDHTYRKQDVTGALAFVRSLFADLWDVMPEADRPRTDREATSTFFTIDRSGTNMEEFLEQLRAFNAAELKQKRKSPKRATNRTGNPLRTVADIKRWIRDHVPHDNDGHRWTPKRLDRAVLWWGANGNASTYSELRTKDIADILIKGLPPFTLQDVQDDLDSVHEGEDDNFSAGNDVQSSLLQHFGLDRNEGEDE